MNPRRARLFVLSTLSLALLSGCATVPQTSEEFRSRVRNGHMFTTIDSFVVHRPLAVVASTFQRKAEDCLRLQLTSQLVGNISSSSPVVRGTTTPTVNIEKSHAELSLQFFYKSIKLSKEPEGGSYAFSVLAKSLSATSTRIEVYRFTVSSESLLAAVRGWATGEFNGCPDPSSFFG